MIYNILKFFFIFDIYFVHGLIKRNNLASNTVNLVGFFQIKTILTFLPFAIGKYKFRNMIIKVNYTNIGKVALFIVLTRQLHNYTIVICRLKKRSLILRYLHHVLLKRKDQYQQHVCVLIQFLKPCYFYFPFYIFSSNTENTKN